MKYEVFWKNPGYKPRPELRADIDCDYLIVGGGVTGVSTAYFLAKAGAKNIVLIEKNEIAGGATGKAAGTLVLRGEIDLVDIVKQHGPEKAKIFWQEIHEGLKGIKRVINDEKIECDAEPQDTLYCDFKHKLQTDLHKEYRAEKDIETTTKFLTGDELKKEINTNLFAHGILSANHGLSVNPLKLTQNLSKTIEKYGVKVYENTKFVKRTGNKAYTTHGSVRYKNLILAIDADHPAREVRKLKATIVITKPLKPNELEKTGLLKKKIVFDAKNKSYDYFKITPDRRFLFGFGDVIVNKKDVKIAPHPPHLKTIKRFMLRLFPYLDLEPEYAWSASFGITGDYDPLIRFKENRVAISGARTQIVCFLAAKYVVNKILGQKSTLEEFFMD